MNLAGLEFEQVGECRLDDRLASGVRFSTNAMQNDRVIYAYVVEDVIKYIGVCDSSTTTLRRRMNRYQGMIGAGTNKRIAGLIKECLRTGQAVKIFAWKPEAAVTFRELSVDLVKGLENPLIQALRPEWNIKG